MRKNMLAAALVIVAAGTGAGSAATPEVNDTPTLFPKPKPPYSELFQVPAPKTTVKAPRPLIVVAQPLAGTEVATPEPRSFTSRIVCGMKMIEGTASMDPGIVKPIPERHGAKVRVLGPPPCADEAPAGPDRR